MGRPDLQVIMHVRHLMDLHLELVEYVECNLIKRCLDLISLVFTLIVCVMIYHVKHMHNTVVV